jgi:hypothetical protein
MEFLKADENAILNLYNNISSNSPFNILYNSEIVVKEEDIENGYLDRFFCRQINDDQSEIVELSKKMYNKEKYNVLYKFVELRWKITGTNENDVKSTNLNTIIEVDYSFPGIKNHLIGRLSQFFVNR